METPQHEPQEKIDFFLVSAHELRTSLSAMKWMFQMLLDGDFGSLNETQSAILKQARTANERMIQLVNDTMIVINTEGSSITYQSLPVSLSSLTEESIKDFTSEAASKGMHLRYTPPPSPVIVIGDPDQLRIALHNLLENAIKYGNSDTDITLSLTIATTNAVLTVADRGIVIPTDEQHKIFEKFFRASNTKETYAGVGLGLYATKHIIERQGGTLAFTSTPETGTTFILSLPIG